MQLQLLLSYVFMANAAPAQGSGSFMGSLGVLIFPVLMLVVLYLLMIRPQKKQEKKQKEERAQMKVGDPVLSIGGIVGKIVNIKDDDITIVTSVAQTMMTFRRDALNKVQPISDAPRGLGKGASDASEKPRRGLFGRRKDEA